jgi:glycosyltransferase involved in cell wall biosynthesis
MIPLVIAAKNEERALGACLDSLLASAAFAEIHAGIRFDPVVVLDDCTDATGAVAAGRGVRTIRSSGGKVEAQRSGLVAGAPFHVFADADIAVEKETLAALARAMEDPSVEVACPPRRPLAPQRRTPIARAIHVYNAHRGFSPQRTWFNGKLFAIRRWAIPTRAELAARLAGLSRDRFTQAHLGLRIDDVYLSRTIARKHGPGAIHETDEGLLWFRPPETLRGMYRYFRRMRMEIERLDRIFPETRATHEEHGIRRTDPAAVARATAEERRLFHFFQIAVKGCEIVYAAERAFYLHLARSRCADWTPIAETKRPIEALERHDGSSADHLRRASEQLTREGV